MKDTILISDTHFGVRNNSMAWFNSQMSFFYDQLIPFMKEKKPERLIHLGDVFDSRSTLNVAIAHKVYQLFKELKKICPVYIIAGNHDYYSPDSDEICSIRLILKDLEDENLTIIDKEVEYVEDAALIPWYKWNKEDLSEISGVKYWFAHTDLEHIEPEILPLLGKVKVYSGHIHTPNRISDKLHILGSCFSIDFNDANAGRNFYEFQEGVPKIFPNIMSIKFWRLYDKDIKTLNESTHYRAQDYFEIYVSKELIQYEETQETIKAFQTNHRNTTIIVVSEEIERNAEINTTKSITEICQEMVPEHLQGKFMKVIDSL